MPLPHHSKALVGLAVLSLAVPAVASADGRLASDPPQFPVPAGQLQHTVSELTWADNKPNRPRTVETWVQTNASRELITDETTGKVLTDCQFNASDTRCYETAIDLLPPAPWMMPSWAQQGS